MKSTSSPIPPFACLAVCSLAIVVALPVAGADNDSRNRQPRKPPDEAPRSSFVTTLPSRSHQNRGARTRRGDGSRACTSASRSTSTASGNNIVGDAANEPSIAVDPADPNRIAIGWRQFDTIASNFRQAGLGYLDRRRPDLDVPGGARPGRLPLATRCSTPTPTATSTTTACACRGPATPVRRVRRLDRRRRELGGLRATPTAATSSGWPSTAPAASARATSTQTWDSLFSCCGERRLHPLHRRRRRRFETAGGDARQPILGHARRRRRRRRSTSPASRRLGGFTVGALEQRARIPAAPLAFDGAAMVDLGGDLSRRRIGPNPGGLLGQVWVAIDHSDGPTRGNVYVLASVDPPGVGPARRPLRPAATDGGLTWSAPVRVNDDRGRQLAVVRHDVGGAQRPHRRRSGTTPATTPGGYRSRALLRLLHRRRRHLVAERCVSAGVRPPPGLAAAEQDRRLLRHGLGRGRRPPRLRRHLQRRAGRLLPADRRLRLQRQRRSATPTTSPPGTCPSISISTASRTSAKR